MAREAEREAEREARHRLAHRCLEARRCLAARRCLEARHAAERREAEHEAAEHEAAHWKAERVAERFLAEREAERKTKREAEREAERAVESAVESVWKALEREAEREAERKTKREAEREAERAVESAVESGAERGAEREAERAVESAVESEAEREAERARIMSTEFNSEAEFCGKLAESALPVEREAGLPTLLIELAGCYKALASDDSNAAMRKRCADLRIRLTVCHPWVKVGKGRPAHVSAVHPGHHMTVYNCSVDPKKFGQWWRAQGRSMRDIKGGDDQVYASSALLRAFLPRGFAALRFTRGPAADAAWAADAATKEPRAFDLDAFATEVADSNVSWELLVGLRKFIGLTEYDEDADEDQEVVVTEEVGCYTRGRNRAQTATFTVTEKSNGENGRLAAREVFGMRYCLAGSKNSVRAWAITQDGRLVDALADKDNFFRFVGKVKQQEPAEKICLLVRRIFDALAAGTSCFIEDACDKQFNVMLEYNDPLSEHMCVIPEEAADFLRHRRQARHPTSAATGVLILRHLAILRQLRARGEGRDTEHV